MPFEHHLKLRLARKHADGVTLHFSLSPEYLNSSGNLHGGITASIADEAAWHALENHWGYGTKKSTTTELKVNYLRPITGKKVIARAHLVRAGRTLCVSRIDIFDEKKVLSAIAIVTYMLL
ncbi:MAG TPA: PaaI family thioesterase [Bryobacteraceae bacterium]|nr:PaaI family thioesterase [Bryobacteraceae bacterium]